MTDLTTLLAGIKTRAEKATPGSWEIKEDCRDYPSVWHDQEVAFSIGRCADCGVEAEYEAEDAAFIASARTDVPRLVAAIEAVAKVHDSTDAVMYSGSRQHMVKVCAGCGTDDGNWQRWPCPTVTAVAAALEGEGA